MDGSAMDRYTNLNGDVFDLGPLTVEERKHLDICVYAYRADMDYAAFSELVRGRGNPLIRENGGLITLQVLDQLLYRVTHDLEDRLGIRQGRLGAEPNDRLEADPFATESEPPSSGAARSA
jgi:hypothetical protein